MLTQAMADALVDAAMKGVRQITGRFSDMRGGFCALGVLRDSSADIDALAEPRPCSCGECGKVFEEEWDLVVHVNDDHEWDFLTIARKLGPSA